MTVTSDLRAEVEIWPFRACAMHPAIIKGTVRSLWTWLWGRYHISQNVFLVPNNVLFTHFVEHGITDWAGLHVCPCQTCYQQMSGDTCQLEG